MGKERAFAPLGVVLVFVAVCDPFSARCLAGSTRWYADTLLWTRVALFFPWSWCSAPLCALVCGYATAYGQGLRLSLRGPGAHVFSAGHH